MFTKPQRRPDPILRDSALERNKVLAVVRSPCMQFTAPVLFFFCVVILLSDVWVFFIPTTTSSSELPTPQSSLVSLLLNFFWSTLPFAVGFERGKRRRVSENRITETSICDTFSIGSEVVELGEPLLRGSFLLSLQGVERRGHDISEGCRATGQPHSGHAVRQPNYPGYVRSPQCRWCPVQYHPGYADETRLHAADDVQRRDADTRG